MKLKEVINQGITRVQDSAMRKSGFGGYLQLNITGGKIGPWLKYISPVEQKSIGFEVPQQIFYFQMNRDADFEPYTGPIREGDSEWSEEKHGIEALPEGMETYKP